MESCLHKHGSQSVARRVESCGSLRSWSHRGFVGSVASQQSLWFWTVGGKEVVVLVCGGLVHNPNGWRPGQGRVRARLDVGLACRDLAVACN